KADQYPLYRRGQGAAALRGGCPVRLQGGGCGAAGGEQGRVRLAGRGQQCGGVAVDKTGGDPVGLHLRVLQQALEEGQVAGHALQPELAQGAIGPAQGGGVVRIGLHDQLGQQRVEAGAGGVAAVAVAIEAKVVAALRLGGAQGAAGGTGADVGLYGFQIDPQLHGEAAGRRYAGLFQAELGQAGPGGQAYLQLDQIEPGDGFGHRVFDLDPRVGFHEYEVAAVLVDQKLDGAQAAITDRRGEGAGGVQQSPAQVGIQPRCRRHFDDLLMTALQAAFPLPQVADLLAVTGDLHFDKPGTGN